VTVGHMIGTVQQDSGGLYVAAEGRRFESPDLDATEGTEVIVEPYMGIGDIARATLTWTVFESTYTVDAREIDSFDSDSYGPFG